jgi:hypothetical protein
VHSRSAAIAWRKTSFRKYFEKEDNFIKFHQLFARELEAPTEATAQLVQEEMVECLKAVKEMRAAVWFEKTWTGEHGNHTNASAGYVGNNKASGCESNCKYAKRDTVGSAGSNVSMSLQTFTPSMIKYVGDTSGKHADKILDKKTGMREFDAVPVITAELWKAVQDFNMLRIRLAYVEHSNVYRIEWQHAADFFTNEGKDEDDGVKSFVEKLHEFRDAGRVIRLARTRVEGINMPTERHVTILTKKKGCDTFAKLERAVHDLVPQYELLFNHTERFMDENPALPRHGC